MSCSHQEIESKRLAALQKLQNKAGGAPQPENMVEPKVVSATVYLISEDRFEVNPSEFSSPLVNVFKTLNTRRFDNKTKLWNFSIDEYDTLMSRVAPLAPHVVLGSLPPYVLNLLKEQIVDPKTIDLSPIDPKLREQLMPFQKDGVRFGVSKEGRCMVADDMGLGKTYQALALASYYRNDWPLLIVTSSSMRDSWLCKVHTLLPFVPLKNVASIWSNKEILAIHNEYVQIVIISFKLSTAHTQNLICKKFGVIIIDESQYLKSHKSLCTLSLTAVAHRARRVILLSGTPALSRPKELYTQLHLIQPHFFSGYVEYGKRYCAGKQSKYGWDMTGKSNLSELQVILHKKFLIRRTKEEVLALQKKIREPVMLDESLLVFDKKQRDVLTYLFNTFKKTKLNEKRAALLAYFSESAKLKVSAVCEYLKQLIQSDNKEKFLVFAHHKVMITAICKALDETGANYVRIVGSTVPTIRTQLLDRYQTDEDCRAAVLSTTTCGAGVTLTAATMVIFAELHWNPGMLVQAECRAHRMGQAKTVRVKYLLARGTVDDFIWPMLQDKLNVLKEVGLSNDNFENATQSKQETENEIPQCSSAGNPNDYIPGTNIRQTEMESRDENLEEQGAVGNRQGDDIDKSFLEDDEGDQLLANLDF